MSGGIPPAMTAERWEQWRSSHRSMPHGGQPESASTPERIAQLNDSLVDSDPRKLTRAHVDALRHVARAGLSEVTRTVLSVADILDSYLPPHVPAAPLGSADPHSPGQRVVE